MGIEYCNYTIFALFRNEKTWRFMTSMHWAPILDIEGAVTSFFEKDPDGLPVKVICFATGNSRKLSPPSKPGWTVDLL